jgi:CheY-like chemotaxis protein
MATIASGAYPPFVLQQAPLVLVIEDDHALRGALAEVLASQGFRTALAVDGQHGLELLERGLEPCVILVDWMMPRMGGQEFLRTRAMAPAIASIPVVVMSASNVPALDNQIQGFAAKPFGTDILEPLLRGVCNGCTASRRKSCGCPPAEHAAGTP